MGIRIARWLPMFAAAFALVVYTVDACRCLPLEVCDGVAQSTVVVHAEALARSDQTNINDPVTYTIRTLTLYKYPTESNVRATFPAEITFSTAGNGAACGVSLEIGAEYLIGLTLSSEGELTANLCGLYRSWSSVTDDELALLETGCFDSACDGRCTWGKQACVFIEGRYTCANTVCDPSLCDENESCTLEEWDCTQEPCPAIATCGESCDRECEEGETCVLNYDVLCLSPPCPPISECVEDDDGEDDPCEGACTELQTCVFIEGSYSCENTVCDPSPCAENESCTLEEWDCTQEPCVPIATCSDTCNRECEEGEKCVLNYEVACIWPPCGPIPECVEDDDGEDDPCEGACTELQDCLLFESPSSLLSSEEQENDEVWYCADFCGPDNCPSEGEVCQLLPVPCADPSIPCPPEASCQQQCDPECDDNQGCFYYDFIGFSCEFDTCDPSPCAANETCAILESFPPIVVCSDRCEALECGPYQECLVNAEGTEDEEPYCADTCAAGTCDDDQTCTLEQVQCVRAPCPPFAMCTDNPARALSAQSTSTVDDNSEYLGCFRDSAADRILTYGFTSALMTTQLCFSHCEAMDAAYAGTQYGIECWCYVTGRSDFDRHEEGAVCDRPCQGNPEEEICGGFYAVSLYKLHWPAAPVNEPEYLNCYRDDVNNRVMTSAITANNMTPAVCRDHCQNLGAFFYGTQYSSECWCGYSTSLADYTIHGDGVCHLECSGDPHVTCGGNFAFDLFEL